MIETHNYRLDILDKLLKKYHKKMIKYGGGGKGRRVNLKITEVYRAYEALNANINIKMQVNEASRTLEGLCYLSIQYLPYSDDIIKIYLNEDKVKDVEGYLEKNFGILARHYIVENIRSLLCEYSKRGKLTDYYCEKLKYNVEHSVAEFDIEKELDLLKVLAFIQDNERALYVREVSMFVYGSSKYFEEKRYDAVCSIIREAVGQSTSENEQDDEILQQYHISNVEQDICIKGDFLVEISGYQLETKNFSGGLSLSSRDIEKIDKITVRTKNVMTIENKTSYYRFDKKEYSTIYLGGYAKRYQIELIKKIHSSNQSCGFLHFGDIDVGGFFIHQHLCNATGIAFGLYHMGKAEIRDLRFRQALIELTAHDIARAEKLMEKSVYKEVLSEMLGKKVKLEQEIISYCLMQG